MIATFFSSCTLATNLKKKPTQWVTVMNVETNKPIPRLPLVYYGSPVPYFIVGPIGESIPYVTNEHGRAYVPRGVSLRPRWESSYELASVDQSPDRKARDDVYYLRRIQHSKLRP